MSFFSNLFKKKEEKKQEPDVVPMLTDEIYSTEKNNDDFSVGNNLPKTDIVTIHSGVVGLNYEGRQVKLKKMINEFKKDNLFYLYDDQTNKEIKEMYPTEDDPFWELQSEYIPYATIKSEPENEYDSNALAVYIGESEKHSLHIGYLPATDAARIKDLVSKAILKDVSVEIKGGKFKYIDYDDMFEEKIKVGSKPYSLSVILKYEK